MNKKGDSFDFILLYIYIVIALMVSGFIILLIGMGWSELGIECKTRSSSELLSVDGRYDEDTGLFAGGSVREKTLLFKNGLVVTLKSYQNLEGELVIGDYYKITKCENNGGRIWYKLEQLK